MHEGGFAVERLDDGAFRFFRPDNREVRVVGPHLPAATGTLVNANRARGLAIDERTCRATWHSEHFDYDHALFVAMANRSLRAR